MKKLLLLLLLSSISMHGLEAAAGAPQGRREVGRGRGTFRPVSPKLLFPAGRGAPSNKCLALRMLQSRAVKGSIDPQDKRQIYNTVREMLRPLREGAALKIDNSDALRKLQVAIDNMPAVRGIAGLLSYIWLSESIINKFPHVPLRHVVEVLDFQECNLDTIPSWLAELPNLKGLWLDGHPYLFRGETDEYKFPPLLEHLSLAANALGTIPAGVQELTALKELNLGGNEDIRIPNDFIFPSTLQILHLGWCGLRVIPTYVRQLSSLKELSLQGNPLADGIETFSFPPNLEKLDLNICGLARLPASLSELSHLTFLSLAGNALDEVALDDYEFPPLLEDLNLTGCGLTRLPASLERLTHLKKIRAAENHFNDGVPTWLQEKIERGQIEWER